jgi:hypothetical protein
MCCVTKRYDGVDGMKRKKPFGLNQDSPSPDDDRRLMYGENKFLSILLSFLPFSLLFLHRDNAHFYLLPPPKSGYRRVSITIDLAVFILRERFLVRFLYFLHFALYSVAIM